VKAGDNHKKIVVFGVVAPGPSVSH